MRCDGKNAVWSFIPSRRSSCLARLMTGEGRPRTRHAIFVITQPGSNQEALGESAFWMA